MWTSQWVNGTLPAWLYPLIPRVLGGKLVPGMADCHGLADLHYIIHSAVLHDKARRLDAIQLAVRWAVNRGSSITEIMDLVRWLQEGIRSYTPALPFHQPLRTSEQPAIHGFAGGLAAAVSAIVPGRIETRRAGEGGFSCQHSWYVLMPPTERIFFAALTTPYSQCITAANVHLHVCISDSRRSRPRGDVRSLLLHCRSCCSRVDLNNWAVQRGGAIPESMSVLFADSRVGTRRRRSFGGRLPPDC